MTPSDNMSGPHANKDMRTEAENHRLILAHAYLVPMLASGFRGVKGIPFDELEGAGMVGLVEAARDWRELDGFVQFANVSIRNQIKDLIRGWKEPPNPDEVNWAGDGTEFYEWQSWGDQDYIFAIAEHWAGLAATPEEIVIAFDEIKGAGNAITSAMIGFTRRERDILGARFFREPPATLESIAREHGISYSRVVYLIDRALGTIREKINSRVAATPTAVRG